ncbi:MAG TPA: FAD-dependent oxidoreductase, partial [Pseudogracilibacillus sp.]|nr:FAD-dependent oxidoreductase [Pseudogracilibacillus sp.]
LKMYADRSYALQAKTDKLIKNMYINVDTPTHSIRPIQDNDETLLIFAGENHRTGVSESPMEEHYNLLAGFADENFKIDEIRHFWSAQDYTTLDKIPYIGSVTKEKDNVFVATGYRKWGMTNGTNAALLICDLILQKDTEFEQFFATYRNAKFNPAIKKFFSYNAEVAKHLVKGKFDNSNEQIDKLKQDEACIVMQDGDRIGVYKDNDSQIHAVDTTCTHMGCELSWNSAEKSWDCPCHGSRFCYKGHVINGPAVRDLRNIRM